MPDEGPDQLSALFDDLNLQQDGKQAQPATTLEHRAHVALEVAFETPAEAVKAYSENVGVGQLSIAAKDVFPKGVEVSLKVRVPGWATPLMTTGKVTWSRPGAMGLAFVSLQQSERELLHKLVMDNTTKLDRVKRQFSRMMEQAVPAKVTARFTALVRMADEMLADGVAELLNESHLFATTNSTHGSRPNLVVLDVGGARALDEAFRQLPVVMVNMAGPNELALNRLPFMTVKGWVPKPATPAKIVQAVGQIVRLR